MPPPAWQIILAVVVTIGVFIQTRPTVIDPVEFSLGELPDFPRNGKLDASKRLFSGQMKAPESFVLGPDGLVYTGLADGRIMRFDPKEMNRDAELVVQTGNARAALPLPCGTYDTEPICGRPLGMEFHPKSKLLIVCDTLGLLAVDTVKKTSLTLTKSAGKKNIAFANDLAISHETDVIYFTDSARLPRRDVPLSFMEARDDGRLLSYDPTTKKSSVIRTGLHFPNGLVWGCNGKCLIVAETTRCRLLKVPLDGGEPSVLLDNMPIWPDGLYYNSDKTSLWVGGNPRRSGAALPHYLANYPAVRLLG